VSEVPMYPTSGQGVIFGPPQILGSHVFPTVGCALATGHLMGRGISLIRNSAPLGPYRRTMPRALWWPLGGGLFLMSEVTFEPEASGVGVKSTWLLPATGVPRS